MLIAEIAHYVLIVVGWLFPVLGLGLALWVIYDVVKYLHSKQSPLDNPHTQK